MDLATRLSALDERVVRSRWDGHEHFRGYGIMALPFSSGHVLGLRVFPENDFAPYQSIWHRTPDGRWSIFNDGPSLDTTCPRWWGPALDHAELTDIALEWTGPNTLRLEMDRPRLTWRVTMEAPRWLQAANRISRSLPAWSWKAAPLVRVREFLARRLLHLGPVGLRITTPRGHETTVLAEEIYGIRGSTARFDGVDLGSPVVADETPHIGDVALPRRPAFFVGEAQARIIDMAEYRRTRIRFAA